jgi:hypothetical protein
LYITDPKSKKIHKIKIDKPRGKFNRRNFFKSIGQKFKITKFIKIKKKVSQIQKKKYESAKDLKNVYGKARPAYRSVIRTEPEKKGEKKIHKEIEEMRKLIDSEKATRKKEQELLPLLPIIDKKIEKEIKRVRIEKEPEIIPVRRKPEKWKYVDVDEIGKAEREFRELEESIPEYKSEKLSKKASKMAEREFRELEESIPEYKSEKLSKKVIRPLVPPLEDDIVYVEEEGKDKGFAKYYDTIREGTELVYDVEKIFSKIKDPFTIKQFQKDIRGLMDSKLEMDILSSAYGRLQTGEDKDIYETMKPIRDSLGDPAERFKDYNTKFKKLKKDYSNSLSDIEKGIPEYKSKKVYKMTEEEREEAERDKEQYETKKKEKKKEKKKKKEESEESLADVELTGADIDKMEKKLRKGHGKVTKIGGGYYVEPDLSGAGKKCHCGCCHAPRKRRKQPSQKEKEMMALQQKREQEMAEKNQRLFAEANPNYGKSFIIPQQGSGFIKGDAKTNVEIDQKMANVPGYAGCIARDEINSKILPQAKKFGKLGFVMNLDKHDQPGSHWVAVFIDGTPNGSHSVEYYNPLADPLPFDIRKDLINLVHHIAPGEELRLKVNMIKDQSDSTNNCGMFASKFLLDRFSGKPFREASRFVTNVGNGEKSIQNFKKTIWEKI